MQKPGLTSDCTLFGMVGQFRKSVGAGKEWECWICGVSSSLQRISEFGVLLRVVKWVGGISPVGVTSETKLPVEWRVSSSIKVWSKWVPKYLRLEGQKMACGSLLHPQKHKNFSPEKYSSGTLSKQIIFPNQILNKKNIRTGLYKDCFKHLICQCVLSL